ncbi:MAG: bifunctional demethylmenaquinone methyltransferase/2-methoxy-6-polyprenyl-1,4-benzoquinol methylase UbiE [Pseudomonadota bacterium]
MTDFTDFGYEQVPEDEKAGRVRAVFDSVASRYDLMNDLMSFGIHRWWKRFAVALTSVGPGSRVLDLAGGTGDLTRLISERVGPSGLVTCSDINAAMLNEGRARLLDSGYVGNVRYAQCDAEALPFADDALDAVTIGFGLRNVTNKDRALAEMFRVLRPGGQVMVLEFSKVPRGPLARLYETYSFSVLPRLGARIAGDADSYRYLAESIRMHPDQATLEGMLRKAGFEQCSYLNLSLGVVAVHRGYKF